MQDSLNLLEELKETFFFFLRRHETNMRRHETIYRYIQKRSVKRDLFREAIFIDGKNQTQNPLR